MIKWISIIALLFVTTVKADLKDWTKQEQRLYDSFITLQTMDLIQTFNLIECQQTNPQCPFYEKNKISKRIGVIVSVIQILGRFVILPHPISNRRPNCFIELLNKFIPETLKSVKVLFQPLI